MIFRIFSIRFRSTVLYFRHLFLYGIRVYFSLYKFTYVKNKTITKPNLNYDFLTKLFLLLIKNRFFILGSGYGNYMRDEIRTSVNSKILCFPAQLTLRISNFDNRKIVCPMTILLKEKTSGVHQSWHTHKFYRNCLASFSKRPRFFSNWMKKIL